MSKLRMAAGAACCIVALFSGGVASAGEAQCWQPHEVEAARVRDLQIMLMLGSLQCRSINSEMTARYQSFSEKRSSHLSGYTNALKLRFMRQNGITEGQHAYDDFMTRLANSHSGAVKSAGFCDMADMLLTLASNAGQDELPVLARNFSERPVGVGDVCEAAAAPMTVAVAAATDDSDLAAPPVDQPVEVAAAAPLPAEAPTPEAAAAALEAAAVALQAAAASLKAPSSPTGEGGKRAVPEVQPAVVAVSKPVG